MSDLYNKASLVMNPQLVDTGKVYSIKPEDRKGDFTFTRSSAATRVNASGNIEKETQNLLTYSNDFNNWSKALCNVTSGQSGYDGSSDAWLLTATGSGNSCRRDVVYSGVNSFSVYAKAGTADGIRLRFDASTDRNLKVDLTDGSLISDETNLAYSIEDVSGGWYRITATSNLTTGINVRLIVTDNTGTQSTGSVYIQDAQLEQGLVARDYIETTTAAVEGGITDNVPRLDYTDSSCPALLLEPQRSNLCTSSEYLNSSIWNSVGSSVTDNDAISPEGLQNAAKVQGDGSQNYIRLYDNLTYPSTGNYTLTFFAKKGNNDFIRVAMLGVTGAESAYFDLANGTTPQTNVATIQAIGTDGWYKCSVSTNLTGPDLTGNYNLYVSYSDTTSTFPSAGDANGKYVYLYGCQLEQGSYATSYIPTYGTSVTRVKDDAITLSIPDVIGQTEGTLFVEYTRNSLAESSFFVLSLLTGTTAGSYGNSIYLFQLPNGRFVSDGFVSSAIQFGFSKNEGLSLGKHKIAIAYAQNNVALFIDGVQIEGTDTSANIPATNFLTIGGGADVTGHRQSIHQTLLFKARLSNQELIDLTTI